MELEITKVVRKQLDGLIYSKASLGFTINDRVIYYVPRLGSLKRIKAE